VIKIKVATKSSEALRILWGEGISFTSKTLSEVKKELENRGYNVCPLQIEKEKFLEEITENGDEKL